MAQNSKRLSTVVLSLGPLFYLKKRWGKKEGKKKPCTILNIQKILVLERKCNSLFELDEHKNASTNNSCVVAFVPVLLTFS